MLPNILSTLCCIVWSPTVGRAMCVSCGNSAERAVALETTQVIRLERLPEMIRNRSGEISSNMFTLPEGPFDLETFLSQIESSLIHQALNQTDGNQTQAAQKLSLTKGSLRHRLQSLQIKH